MTVLAERRRHVLLLTGTIVPMKGLPALARVDPAARLKDYAHALEFYLGHAGTTFSKIVFAENSGADLTPLKEMVESHGKADRVEFVSTLGLDYPATYGRGYGEFKLVDHAMATAESLRQWESDLGLVVWKCTGRYIVSNVATLVSRAPDAFDVYCHKRNHPYVLCELYMMAWTASGYRAAVRGAYQLMRNDTVPGKHSIEETLFRAHLDKLDAQLRIVPRFRQVPLISGVRGWNNTHYANHGWQPKIVVRRIANVLAPSLWI